MVDAGSCVALIRRLLGSDPLSSLAIMLARGGDAVHVSADECVELVALLGRWHADEGVLPADLSDLRDAVTAAALRQDAVRR